MIVPSLYTLCKRWRYMSRASSSMRNMAYSATCGEASMSEMTERCARLHAWALLLGTSSGYFFLPLVPLSMSTMPVNCQRNCAAFPATCCLRVCTCDCSVVCLACFVPSAACAACSPCRSLQSYLTSFAPVVCWAVKSSCVSSAIV